MKKLLLTLIPSLLALSGCGFAAMEPVCPFGKNLSNDGTANCYIITEPGDYSFRADRGNTVVPVGEVSSVEVLWESFGTSTSPKLGELVQGVRSAGNHWISLTVPSPMKHGNVLIAAKDDGGEILWSWHIWLTGPVGELTYAGNVGILMDRNLGATSVSLGSPECNGLHYQWGRKDPFLASGYNNKDLTAANNGIDQDAIHSSSVTGNFEYAHRHPTTFIYSSGSDWLQTPDNTAWGAEKTINDPCPAGWKVCYGGTNGVWERAGFPDKLAFDSNLGLRVPEKYCGHECWFPASGYHTGPEGILVNTGQEGYWWSQSTVSGKDLSYGLSLDKDGNINTCLKFPRSAAFAIRCVKE